MLTTPSFMDWLPAVLIAAAALLICAVAIRSLVIQRSSLRQAEAQYADTRQRLETVLQLNRELVEARDEKTLVDAALSAVNRLVGGLGVSFVPFDAWGQPLPAFTFGDLPEPVLKGWAEHLVSEQVRNRCSQCTTLRSPAGQPCPLKLSTLGETMSIICLPLSLGKRSLGVVNIYLAPEQNLDSGQQTFIEGLLDEMALAVETMRLHNQEINTLRQLHLRRSPGADLTTMLQSLLDVVRNTLVVDKVLLRVRPMVDDRLSELCVISGELAALAEDDLQIAVHQAMTAVETRLITLDNLGMSCFSVPLSLPEGQVLGALLAFSSQPDPGGLDTRQVSVLQTAAAQAALIIENERLTLSLEYTLVIQERTRLAREIHDGLAQTLAFLKMQTAQMQTAHTQNDNSRLSRLLNENRQALADAYQETRQVIDNLRLNPDESLIGWLEQSAHAFEKNAGIPVKIELQVNDPAFLPEVQAQLVRIVQEALNNVRKHSRAAQVRISLRDWGGDLLLEISDDGQGFDPDDIPPVAQYGLRGMRERAELIGADFQIISHPRSGTTVRLNLPMYFQEVNE
jgi:two-component system nitrate/nitrite sensor histidine kinase NarX